MPHIRHLPCRTKDQASHQEQHRCRDLSHKMNNLSLCTLPCCLPAFWSFLTWKVPLLPVPTIALVVQSIPCLPPGLFVAFSFRLFPFFGDRLHLLISHKRRPEIERYLNTEYL